MPIDTLYSTFHTSLVDLDPDPRSKECEKTTNTTIISQSFFFNRSQWNFGILLGLVGVMNLMLILFPLFHIEGIESFSSAFVKI